MKKTKLSKVAAVIAAGAACAAFGFAAVACGDEEHTHKWADAWTTNSTHHWHVCTAGDDCKEISGKDTHKDNDEDGKCDVCQYVMSEQGHEHVWATAWTSDATHHWHKCTVEGCTEINGKAEHGEANEDGKCPTCEKELGGGGGGEEAVANTAKLTFADTTLTVVYVVPTWADPQTAYITVYDSADAEIEGATGANITAGTNLTLTQNWSDCSLYIYFMQGETKKYSETLDSTRLHGGQTYTLEINNDDWNGDCFGVSGAEAKQRVAITDAKIKGNHDDWSEDAAGNVMTEVTPDLDIEGVLQQWEVTITFTAETEFGISYNGGNWIGYSGLDTELSADSGVTSSTVSLNNFKLAAGTYRIVLCSYAGYGNNKIVIIAA